MKRLNIISIIICTIVLGLAGCKSEELNTDQLSEDQVKLGAIAPNPVARGGALRIIGSNLQKVQQVEIPGVDPITDIEVVSSGRVSEIRVIVPVEGPEIGPVSIVAEGCRYTSKCDLSYSEPIVFDSFSPASAMPGDVITIKGDYMNNIRQVVFEGGATVTKFESQNRHELKVKVPSAAITGKIILGDVDESNNPEGNVSNLFYSEKELEIGDPTVNTKSYGVIKAGTAVTVTGAYLDMIEAVRFGLVYAEFTVAEDGKSLTVALPDTSVDGDLSLFSYAAKEFKAGTFETLVPSDLKIAAATRYKAGLDVTITGKDIDLVSSGSLAGTALSLAVSDEAITFTIPAEAKDGTVTLALANGKTVDTDAIELVKPVITSVSPLELYAGDENITVTGEDLDLVVSATLGGKAVEIKEGASEEGLELVTELTSVSGKIALALANGETVESDSEVKVNYHSLVIVTEMPSAQHIGEEVVLKGSNFDLVENIFIGNTKVTKYSIRTAEEVRFLMPWCTVGSYMMSFHLFNGDVETVATPIDVQLERIINTIWEGSEPIHWGGMNALSWGGYDWSSVPVGAVLTAYFDLDADQDYWQIRFGNGSWDSIPSGLAAEPSEGNIPLTAGATFYSIKLTAEDLDCLVNKGGLVMTGTNYTLTKLVITTEISQEVTIFEGPVMLTWGDDGRFGLATSYFENLSAGSKMIIYFTQTENWGQVQINDGSWSDAAFNFPELGGAYIKTDMLNDKSINKMELTLTQDILDHIKGTVGDYFGVNNDYQGDGRSAMVIQGSDWIIDKITIL